MQDSSRNTGALRRTGFGLLSRKERLGLTWRGWLISLATLLCLSIGGILGVHSFLAVNNILPGELLVVEGWIPEYALVKCGEIFHSHGFHEIVTVGGAVGGADYPPAYDDTYAYVAAHRLMKLGVDKSAVHMAPTAIRTRDRTYSSAIALRDWLAKTNLHPSVITVATLGPHARRTRLLYEKAFGSKVKIGIVAVDDREYDPHHWWKYSEGVKEVMSEGGAYLYARFLFHPKD
jgi:hypothetical protein